MRSLDAQVSLCIAMHTCVKGVVIFQATERMMLLQRGVVCNSFTDLK